MSLALGLLVGLVLGWQQPAASAAQGPTLGNAQTQQWKFGAVLSANNAAGKNLAASLPFPIDWPEQQVKIVRDDAPKDVKLSYKPLTGRGATQLVVAVANLPAGQKREATVVVEVQRRPILPPAETSNFLLPEAAKLKPEVRSCLSPSRHIESDHAKIQAQAQEIISGKAGAWRQVEALYDWVREHVKDRNSADKGALKAIQNGYGDGVEISSAFVALCRAAGVPARLVWLPRHCYPEFYLEDGAGQGYWFPCRAAGKREFGGLTEYRPILSKGDKFPSPDGPKETERFVAESATGFGGQPSAQFIREIVK
jgi:hypothetical protein